MSRNDLAGAGDFVTALKEEDPCPAIPEDGYDWATVFSERMDRH